MFDQRLVLSGLISAGESNLAQCALSTNYFCPSHFCCSVEIIINTELQRFYGNVIVRTHYTHG